MPPGIRSDIELHEQPGGRLSVHPAEEHGLVHRSASRHALTPGSLEERDAVARIDDARYEATRRSTDTFEARRRRARRAWGRASRL